MLRSRISVACVLAGLSVAGRAAGGLVITSPAAPGLTADREFAVTWTDGDAGDAIITWYCSADARGGDRRRIVTLFHDDFEDGATDRWRPRAGSVWRIVRDPLDGTNLAVQGSTGNEYLGTARRDLGDVVVSARIYERGGIKSGVAVRYGPEGEPPSYRLRGNLRLWKRPGNKGLAETRYRSPGGWLTYELAAWNLPDGAVSLEGWVFSADGRLLARTSGRDRGGDANARPAGVALHDTDYFDDVYVDPVAARFVRDRRNRFVWDTASVPAGRYYVLAEVHDGDDVTTAVGPHAVRIRHAKPVARVAAKDRRYGWGSIATAEAPRVPGESLPSERSALGELGRRVKGFVVWESNRTGRWELYRRNTDGSGFKQLTRLSKPREPLAYDRYLRPRVSPDGGMVLFAYGKKGRPVEAWLVSSEGGDARRLTVGNPLRWSAGGREVLFVRDHQVWRRELVGGQESLVHPAKVPPSGADGSMVGDVRADLKAAVFRTRKNEYFIFAEGKTAKTTGGCEPGFSADGRHLYWVQGPKDFRVWDILRGTEERFFGEPPGQRWNYTYFPTVSEDGRWLAYGASPGQHSHTTSDYEVFLQELKDWKPVGRPVRVSWHPRTDRWPFLHRSEGAPERAVAAPVSAGRDTYLEFWRGWSLAPWASPGTIRPPDRSAAERQPLVVESADPAGKDKLALVLPVSLDLSGVTRVVLRAENRGGSPFAVAVALATTEENVYHELPYKQVLPGATVELAFGLRGSDWKTASSEWKHGTTLEGSNRVRSLTVLIYHGGKSCLAALSRIRYE